MLKPAITLRPLLESEMNWWFLFEPAGIFGGVKGRSRSAMTIGRLWIAMSLMLVDKKGPVLCSR